MYLAEKILLYCLKLPWSDWQIFDATLIFFELFCSNFLAQNLLSLKVLTRSRTDYEGDCNIIFDASKEEF